MDQPTSIIDELIEKTQQRVSIQQGVVAEMVGTDRHEAEVKLMLIFQDILFEMEEARRILRRVAGPPHVSSDSEHQPRAPSA